MPDCPCLVCIRALCRVRRVRLRVRMCGACVLYSVLAQVCVWGGQRAQIVARTYPVPHRPRRPQHLIAVSDGVTRGCAQNQPQCHTFSLNVCLVWRGYSFEVRAVFTNGGKVSLPPVCARSSEPHLKRTHVHTRARAWNIKASRPNPQRSMQQGAANRFDGTVCCPVAAA